MEHLKRDLIGTTTGTQIFAYSWRDIALYALGVGAGQDELEYLFEGDLKALPTFGVVPYWGTFGIDPPRSIPSPINTTLGLDRTGSLHMAHKLVLHKPIEAMGAVLTFQDSVTEIFDRGGKGAVMRTELTAWDAAGERVFTNIGDTLFSAYVAPGSPLYPKSTVEFPVREPDFVYTDVLSPAQHLLYRMSGDTNRLHVSLEEAHKQGFEMPIMQGLCSFGYACRLALRGLIPGEPQRMSSMEAQFRSPLYPGTEVELKVWKLEAGSACFRMTVPSTGQVVLEKGAITWA